jgi:asparagine synthase (glutamine-hydrolysing)
MSRPLDEHVQCLYAEAQSRGRLDRELYTDFFSFLADDILPKVDRMSMAVSLETRVPYLDREMVELAFRIPERLKMRDGQTKWILKKVAERHLPPAVVHRRKEGFSAPLKHWIRTSHRALMDDLLDDGEIARQGLFRAEEVRRLKREHLAGQRNHAHILWSLMLFQGWQRRWLEGDAIPRSAQAAVVAQA